MPATLARALLVPLAFVGLLVGGTVAAAANQDRGGAAIDTPLIESQEAELFALNLYHEARSDGREGMIAVGWVVLNRVADPDYPDSVAAVITDGADGRCKWGWLCDGRSDRPKEAEMWALARDVTALLAGPDRPDDPTSGALWFHQTSRQQPAWMGSQVRRTATLGSHQFYGRN